MEMDFRMHYGEFIAKMQFGMHFQMRFATGSVVCTAYELLLSLLQLHLVLLRWGNRALR